MSAAIWSDPNLHLKRFTANGRYLFLSLLFARHPRLVYFDPRGQTVFVPYMMDNALFSPSNLIGMFQDARQTMTYTRLIIGFRNTATPLFPRSLILMETPIICYGCIRSYRT